MMDQHEDKTVDIKKEYSCTEYVWLLLAPEASWGLSYFKPGVPSGYCCVCESGYCNRVCYRGSSEMSQIHVQWSHFLTAIGYCGFWCCFITKVCSVHHIIIVMFINGVCYRGSSEMSQIWVQRSHFLTAIGYCAFLWCFITKVCSVHHIIIVMFINLQHFTRPL